MSRWVESLHLFEKAFAGPTPSVFAEAHLQWARHLPPNQPSQIHGSTHSARLGDRWKSRVDVLDPRDLEFSNSVRLFHTLSKKKHAAKHFFSNKFYVWFNWIELGEVQVLFVSGCPAVFRTNHWCGHKIVGWRRGGSGHAAQHPSGRSPHLP